MAAFFRFGVAEEGLLKRAQKIGSDYSRCSGRECTGANFTICLLGGDVLQLLRVL